MNPEPPILVIRKGIAFWVEQLPAQEWVATVQAVREGCFLDCVCFDATGAFWPIVDATVNSAGSLLERLTPWHQVPVSVAFGNESRPSLSDVVLQLTTLLEGDDGFTEASGADKAEVVRRLKLAATPLEVIRISSELN